MNNTYLIVLKSSPTGTEYIQARDYKTGRAKSYSKIISFLKDHTKR